MPKPTNLTSLASHAAQPEASQIKVVIRDLVTEAHVGLHPWEQFAARPTRLVVNIEMFAPLTRGLDTEHAGGIVDYDVVRNALLAWPTRPHTPLLETLVGELVSLCFTSGRVTACRVSVIKPDIYNEAAGAGVEAYVRREDFE